MVLPHGQVAAGRSHLAAVYGGSLAGIRDGFGNPTWLVCKELSRIVCSKLFFLICSMQTSLFCGLVGSLVSPQVLLRLLGTHTSMLVIPCRVL